VLMPAMSGIECAHLLQERYPKAHVILISGSIFEDKRPHPDERGTNAYLEKSEVPERLCATILALAADATAAPLGQADVASVGADIQSKPRAPRTNSSS
jgi:CheY-like chemotaxis protein